MSNSENVGFGDGPLVAIETDSGVQANAKSEGVAFHLADNGAIANVAGNGVAYCRKSGTANANADGIAYVRANGIATSGDGGVSVCKGSTAKASCESYGVAFARSESKADIGRVKGGPGSILILSWVDGSETHMRSAQVLKADAGCGGILAGRWYTLDQSDPDMNTWTDVTNLP
jgi:hypothetical protein